LAAVLCVVKAFPQVQVTVVGRYFGWMSGFTFNSCLVRSPGRHWPSTIGGWLSWREPVLRGRGFLVCQTV